MSSATIVFSANFSPKCTPQFKSLSLVSNIKHALECTDFVLRITQMKSKLVVTKKLD